MINRRRFFKALTGAGLVVPTPKPKPDIIGIPEQFCGHCGWQMYIDRPELMKTRETSVRCFNEHCSRYNIVQHILYLSNTPPAS